MMSKDGKKDQSEYEQKIEELEELARVNEDKYKRALADYQNLEKRVREEKSDWIRQAGSEIVFNLLPVLDTLSLANKHEENKTLDITEKQFIDILAQVGVEKINTKDAKFDAELMECIEKVGDGEDIIEELRPGFLMNGVLLRPAQVKVGSLNNN